MKHFSKLILLVFILFSLNSTAQEKPKYSRVLTYSQMMEEIINCKEEEYRLENALIESDNYQALDSVVINSHIALIGLTLNNVDLKFNNFVFNKGLIIDLKEDYDNTSSFILIDNSIINKLYISIQHSSFIRIKRCVVNNSFHLFGNVEGHSNIEIVNSEFNIGNSAIINDTIVPRRSGRISLSEKVNLKILSSVFNSTIKNSWFEFSGKVFNFEIDSCIFNTEVKLGELAVIKDYNITNSEFLQSVDMQGVVFPASNLVDLRWEQFISNIGIIVTEQMVWFSTEVMIGQVLMEIYISADINQARNTKYYYKLTSTYKKLLSLYKDRGDLESQNACYVAMKDMETVRLEYLYRSNKSVKTYLYWKLNLFLKYFAEYGTSPVRSVMVSMWVILAFSLIYFFLYSDWDQIDRKFLIAKHRKLLEYFSKEQKLEDFYIDNYKDDFDEYETYKNELETSKIGVPFLIRILGKPLYYSSLFKHNLMVWIYNKSEILQGKWIDLNTGRKIYVSIVVGFSILVYITYLIIIRILNSLMLSINTFSTLGFGNIPVQGGARYIAILEGFIGWFLLSIFSVALISQILQG